MKRPPRSVLLTTLLTAALLQVVGWAMPALGAPAEGKDVGPGRAADARMNLTAWEAVPQMTPGINIGNTLENTTTWETGWGNPLITRAYVQQLADLGFKTVRLPVAWDTYAVDGKIQPEKLQRVAEVVDWILDSGMFCVVNIHWDGGWIDSGDANRFPDTHATFSPEAERKFRAYWEQIARYFADRGEKLIFESLNEETNFAKAGSEADAYATLTRVNQLFVDTVRGTGGNNANRLLVVAGYKTDISQTCDELYRLPMDTAADRLFISVHYYTPWQFVGLEKDADWGKVQRTWGSAEDRAELNRLFDMMAAFCQQHDIPAFLGEYNVVVPRETPSRIRWLTTVTNAAIDRHMVPVFWDTGGDLSRREPYAPSDILQRMLAAMHDPEPAP